MDNPLIALPISILILIISAAFGRKLLGIMNLEADTPLERSIFGVGLGLGALACLILIIGLLGLLQTWAFILLISAIGILSTKEIFRILAEVSASVRNLSGVKLKAADVLIAISMTSLGALALIAALAPPSALDWDGLAYHLAVPKMYIAEGAIHYIPWMSHSNFPFLIQMLYTFGLAIDSVSVAKLFHFWMYIICAAAVYSICRRYLNAKTGSVAALLFMSIPVVLWEAGTAYTDIATALYVTLGAYAVLNWEADRRTPWLALAGLMMGFALGTKVFAGLPLAVLCLWVLLSAGRSESWGKGLTLAAIVGISAIVIGAPWYVKSWIYTGNPVYPFMYNIFGGKYWSEQAGEAYRHAQLAFGMGRGLGDLAMLPWNLTMHGVYFFDDPNPESPKLFSLIGAAFLGLIPLRILLGGKDKIIWKIGILSAVFIIVWFFLMQQTRYLIPVMPLFAIIAASGWDAANSRWNIGGRFANIFIGFCVAISILTGLILVLTSGRAALGLEPREEYLSNSLDVFNSQSFINEYTPLNAKVLFFDEVRGFYLDREYMWGNPGHHEITPWDEFENGRDMAEYFKGEGFTHALINWKFSSGEGRLQTYIAENIATGLMREIYAANGVSVYEFGEL